MNRPQIRQPYASRVRHELVRLAEEEQSFPLVRSAARVRVVVAVVIALALIVPATIFALTVHPRTSPAGESSAPAEGSQALLLVPTIWRVRDAAGESPDTWISFGTSVDLMRPKGDVYLSWSTQSDAMLTNVDGWTMTLGTTPPKVPWLTSTTRFVNINGGWVLTDAAGHRTAQLVKDGAPPPSKQSTRDVPTVDAMVRKEHADAVAGASVRALDPATAVGTWGLPGVAAADGSLTLSADGRWSAKTSCEVLGDANGGGGAFRALPNGYLLATEGGIAGVGCAPEVVPPADAGAILNFFQVGSIAIDGSRLIVYDRAGARLGTLERKP